MAPMTPIDPAAGSAPVSRRAARVPGRPSPSGPLEGEGGNTSRPGEPLPGTPGRDPSTPAASTELALFTAAGPLSPKDRERADPTGTPGPETAAAPLLPGQAAVRAGVQDPAGGALDGARGAPAGSRGLRGKDFRDAMRRAQTGHKTTRGAASRRPVAPMPEPVVGGAELTASAHCIRGCDWTAGRGDPGEVDKAAEKHVRVGHPTSTIAEVTP